MNCLDPSLFLIILCVAIAGLSLGLLVGWMRWAPLPDYIDEIDRLDTYQGRYPQGIAQAVRDASPPGTRITQKKR